MQMDDLIARAVRQQATDIHLQPGQTVRLRLNSELIAQTDCFVSPEEVQAWLTHFPLYNEIKKILGLDRVYNLIVVGGGNIGQALVNYTSFEKRGFVITAVFDVNPRLIGMSIRGIEIYDVDTMEEYVKSNKVDVAILTLPRSQAAKAASDLASWGIKGIWNFSHVDLDLPKDVVVENVHLTDSLMTLLYKINEVSNETEQN